MHAFAAPDPAEGARWQLSGRGGRCPFPVIVGEISRYREFQIVGGWSGVAERPTAEKQFWPQRRS